MLTSAPGRGSDRITITGALTEATAGLLDDETVELCRSHEGTALDLVLDLTEVAVLDMAGIAALCRVHCRAVLQGGLRLGLPVADKPSRLLIFANEYGLLPPTFRPSRLTF